MFRFARRKKKQNQKKKEKKEEKKVIKHNQRVSICNAGQQQQ